MAADTRYDRARTALLLVDPYNDFLASEGKLWPLAKEVAEDVNLLSHLRAIVDAARQAGIQVIFVPHHRWEPGDYSKWKHATRTQIAAGERQPFAKGTWGGTLSTTISNLKTATSLSKSTGRKAVSQTQTSTTS